MGLFNHLLFQHQIFQSFLWIVTNHIEIIATLAGIIYILYSVEGNKLLWYYGFITSVLYVYVFYHSGLYADMGINMYYVIVSVYGWIHWTFRKRLNQQGLPISLTRKKDIFIIVFFTLILFVAIAFILKNYTDSSVPFIDALIGAASIVATWMLARKMLEQWLIWIVVDAVSIGLYIYKMLYPTALLFVVYTVLAITGYFEWRKQWKQQEIVQ